MSQTMTGSEETIREALSEYLAAIEDALLESLEGRGPRSRCIGIGDPRDLPPNLLAACRYSVLAGGKRLRPLLCVLCSQACGGQWRRALPAAVATEFIHAFSLVHDDLPAMDNDELRRGRPTVWVQYGEAMAILAGDALQSLAFELLCDDSYSPEVSAALIRELADATTRMISGQVCDTLGGLDLNRSKREQIERIHENKTGALIRASCCMGAIVAGADEDSLTRIARFGKCLGLMFQIVDDLLDVTQSAEHIGKATGKDIEAGKLTFPQVVGVEASRAEITRLHRQARDAMQPLGEPAAPLLELCDYLAVRTK